MLCNSMFNSSQSQLENAFMTILSAMALEKWNGGWFTNIAEK